MLARTLAAALLAATPALAAPPVFETPRALLEALETADEDLSTLSAEIRHDRTFEIQGDRQVRVGELYYRAGDPDSNEESRAFAVHFEKAAIGRRLEKRPRRIIFDGRWLTELIYEDKLVMRHEVVPPGEAFDPLRVGEGPLPIPIGQKADDILSRYDASLPPLTDGLDDIDDKGLIAFVSNKDAVQLRLVPKPGADDEFTDVRLWYTPDGPGGRLLPRMSITLNHAGDRTVVQLVQVKINGRLPSDAFDDEPPRGWEVQEIPFRRAASGDGGEP